jgi:hypothetical protein
MEGGTENMAGKNIFYPKAEEALKSEGYQYFDGEKDIKGKSAAHRSRPDYVSVKNNDCVIGEIKSPDEPPTSGSWRQVQPNDSSNFSKVREDVKQREKSGQLNPEIGGHEIIIRGQIPDYVSKIGKTYDLPANASDKKVRGGYTVPSEQAMNVETALANCGKQICDKIDSGNGLVTFVFEF